MSTELLMEAIKNHKLVLIYEDFLQAKHYVRPSAMREVVYNCKIKLIKQVLVEVPHVSWSEVGGHGDVKQQLLESVLWPLHVSLSFFVCNLFSMLTLLPLWA